MSRILHTADWHLGAHLAGEERLDEQAAFLKWLGEKCATLKPDMLIVAGDVFDSSNPPQSAQELYYRFLASLRIAAPQCGILILGGNHDSPAMLEAPKKLFLTLKIDVFGKIPEVISEAVIELNDCVICAVPYLRDHDIRRSIAGQSDEEITASIREGVAGKYVAALEAAKAVAKGRPIVATGHLAAVGAQKSQSERSICIGKLDAISADCFDGFDYAALGHIHKAQKVGGRENVRYSGSPLPMDFSESERDREIRVIEVAGSSVTNTPLPVPTFRKLFRIEADIATIAARLASCAADADATFEPWIELTVTDGRGRGDLEKIVEEASRGQRLKVLKKRVPSLHGEDAVTSETNVSLEDFTPIEVFAKKLAAECGDALPGELDELRNSFESLLLKIREGTIGIEGGAK